LVLAVGLASAKRHPVPLEKGITDAQCLDCHKERVTGKVVHAAVGTGCSSCHTIRGSGDDTRVTLNKGRVVALCASCHPQAESGVAQRGVHPPILRDCLTCHEPHASEHKALLKKSTAGDKDANLCLECHTTGVDVPKDGSRHAALDSGCETCHTTHKTGDSSKDEFRYHLRKSAAQLCADCHDAADKNLQKAHSNQPLAGANCVSCHDPHQSKTPKLMQAFVHAPFSDTTGCATCHAEPQSGKVKLTQADAKSLCATCHEEQTKKIEAAKVTHAGAQGDCTSCHDPHAGKFARFIKPDPVSVCESCHSAQSDLHKSSKTLHHPAFGQGCHLCHNPHGNDNKSLLRATGNDLCNACHAPDAAAPKVAGTTNVSLFGGSVVVPEQYMKYPQRLHLTKAGLGHPLPQHPVAGNDPSDPAKKNQITCTRCHLPHAGERKLLITKSSSTAPLCAQCHKNPE
jgi:predicted CXXCH cytochrome family protein